jgi:hypothetical protein
MFQGLNAEEYYGPPRPGQSYQMYNEYMSMKNVAIGGGIVALAVINPIVGIAAGIGWLLSGPETTKSKPMTQGG